VIGAALVVFDLDGTLIDSRRDLTDSANALIVERDGHPLEEDAIARMVGDGAALLVRRALTAAQLPFSDAEVTRFLEIYGGRLLCHTTAYPGMNAALEDIAHSAVVAVLTNKPLAPARVILDALGLSPFIATAIGGDGPYPRKPDPSSLRHLMTIHGAAPAETVLVGDTRIDFETAQNAGVHVCLARYGFGYEQFDSSRLTGVEALVDSPSEIPDAVRRLLNTTPPRR
jgi:phosphoglycolate phosphatase